jgi:magnesium-transporting ATPase (P-type)
MKKLLLIAAIFSFMFIIEQAWAQESESIGKDFFKDPGGHFLNPDGSGITFLLFVIGIAIYALFVWYFYRFISKRDLFPKFFYILEGEEKPTKAKTLTFVGIYIFSFPIIIFLWFTVLAFFVYMIAEEMPMYLAIFVSMSIIAVVRILAYYREEASKEIAKMIPYAILAFFLTSAAVYQDPHFFTEKDLGSVPSKFIESLEGIVFAVVIVSIFEYSFRIGFIIKRKLRPVADIILEEDVEKQVEGISKIHFKKLEDKEKELEKKLEEMMKKLKDSEKSQN